MPISLQDLTAAGRLLRLAKVNCGTVRDLFLGHDTDTAARLGDICQRIDNEHQYVERLIAKPANGGANV